MIEVGCGPEKHPGPHPHLARCGPDRVEPGPHFAGRMWSWSEPGPVTRSWNDRFRCVVNYLVLEWWRFLKNDQPQTGNNLIRTCMCDRSSFEPTNLCSAATAHAQICRGPLGPQFRQFFKHAVDVRYLVPEWFLLQIELHEVLPTRPWDVFWLPWEQCDVLLGVI